ncbi:MAG: UDP-N-acetylglucosamine 2-epimerase (non-hydrolyzing) [Candidatus Bipolaricaulota bacterium]|nr:UDP-N-acetylglucosamine 2-epimerase (non-hydrolyzing) [Candidatus Bipolaricaulota bacterium]MCS7274550.1 UDP-N-acetylglucosamine 2-epimerase (non-hydrolyzing) [Candidatus Bipolaricaulota bacterium]MDW8111205.1 UDP-N-acetylglucosamine 2-epimerase (non-hydrolyzing) [Candidatus Bipolaricaulota bacterium]MDW8329868.1 UDP-N-acetylglucosamine 2-epimerase (non-hydrolyzing) [Candidatus Bipolaricaulota bacterium]
MRVLTVFGTRPEAIKLAPVLNELQKFSEIVSRVCVTAQHRQMLDQVLHIFKIKPDYDLNLMRPNQSLYQITADALLALEPVIQQEKPDLLITQGDTTTAFVASLAAFYAQIKIARVEAGLRTHDKYSPFPEEINRLLADALADLHFAPTERARQNLLREGIPTEKIFVTGNTVIDALQQIWARVKDLDFRERFPIPTEIFAQIERGEKKLLLITGHRRESFGPEFESICLGLKKIAQEHPDVVLIYPVHLNPNVRAPVQKILAHTDRVFLMEPLEYERFVWLMGRAFFILTDSGGIQEEAPALGKPVLVMRKVTERPEAIEAGTAKLVGTDSQRIFEEAAQLLEDRNAYEQMARAVNPFGDGHAAERIVKILRERF